MPQNATKEETENSEAKKEEEIAQGEIEKGYHKEGWIEPKKNSAPETPEEKEARMQREEQEQMQKIIERSKAMKQMAYLNLKSDVFSIY